MNELNEEEKRVIINKGTEMPFTGEYLNNKENVSAINKYTKGKLNINKNYIPMTLNDFQKYHYQYGYTYMHIWKNWCT